jgi:hypothetical protein
MDYNEVAASVNVAFMLFSFCVFVSVAASIVVDHIKRRPVDE